MALENGCNIKECTINLNNFLMVIIYMRCTHLYFCSSTEATSPDDTSMTEESPEETYKLKHVVRNVDDPQSMGVRPKGRASPKGKTTGKRPQRKQLDTVNESKGETYISSGLDTAVVNNKSPNVIEKVPNTGTGTVPDKSPRSHHGIDTQQTQGKGYRGEKQRSSTVPVLDSLSKEAEKYDKNANSPIRNRGVMSQQFAT